jgi:O-antigen ligase
MYVFVSYPIAQYHHGVAIYVVFCFGLVLLLVKQKATIAERGLIALISLASVFIVFITLSKTAIIAYVILMMTLFFNQRWMLWFNIFLCFFILISNPLYVRNAVVERFNIIAFAYHSVESITTQPEPVVVTQPEPVVVTQPEPVVVTQPEPVVVTQPEFAVKDAGVSERIKLWKTAINLFVEKRWFGHGYRSLGDKYDAVSIDDAKYPHNIVLQVLSELGMVGFILFLAMFFSLLTQLITSKIHKKSILYGFIMMSLPAIFISLQLEDLYIWLGFLIIAIYTSSVDSDSSGASV